MTSLYWTPIANVSIHRTHLPMYRTPLRLAKHTRTRNFAQPALINLNSSPHTSRPSTTPSTTQPTFNQRLSAYIQNEHHHPQPNPSMSFLLPGLRRGLLISTPLILSTPLLAYQFRHSRRILCDGPDPLTKITNDLTGGYTTEARTPIITQSGAANPRAIRQVSMGSILGVIGGLGISVFSKPLAVLIGLGIFVLQVCHECNMVMGAFKGRDAGNGSLYDSATFLEGSC